MQKTSAYQSLVKTFQRLSRFSHLSSIASWDMFTMMPPGGSAARGEALAEIPSYKPGTLPAVPGHEPVGRIVAVPGDLTRERLGLSDATWAALVNLCADICRRYGFRLAYDGTRNATLSSFWRMRRLSATTRQCGFTAAKQKCGTRPINETRSL